MTLDPPLPRSASGFRTARQLYEAEFGARVHPAPAADPSHPDSASSSFLVLPECGLAETRRLWNLYLEFRDLILADPACYDEIAGRKEMNRTGATRLAVPFGLSIEERAIEEGRVQLADSGDWDYRFRVRVRVGKGQRFVDGIGSCRVSEVAEKPRAGEIVPLSLREHFALTRAWTRAVKRAIADIVGGTEAEA
jgi:hypothetical protein